MANGDDALLARPGGAPPPNWDAKQIPPQAGKIVVVTGANSGIGYVTARELVRKGAHVILGCRNVVKGRDAEKRIMEETAGDGDAVGQAEFMQLDVSSLTSVQSFSKNFRAKFDKLHVLVNNAGISNVPYTETEDGYESQFATNHLGHFALTASLFDLLKAGAPSRVVNVSSVMHISAWLDVDQVMTPKSKYWPIFPYNNTKLCNLLFAIELARRLKAQGVGGVTSVAAHPGATWTPIITMGARTSHWLLGFFWRLFTLIPIYQHVGMGALPSLYAATAPGVMPGQFFGPGGFFGLQGYPALCTPRGQSYSLEAAIKLWQQSEQMAKLVFNIQ